MVKATKPQKRASSGETLASSAYERIRFDLISGEFELGGKLLIRELCSRYKIGLSPIREALNRLSRDGLVQQNDQRGFFVTPLTEEDLVDITQIRCWSNEAALRQSIAAGDQAWEEHLLIAFHRMARQSGPGDYTRDIDPAWEKSHRAFHSALIAACRSKWLIGFCEQLFDAADRYRFLARRAYRGKVPRRDDHREIMDAALRRDADEAVKLLKNHFMQTLEFSRAEIRRLNARNARATARARPKLRAA
jgi:GntR family transcriptional regulator, carbon starvation induced regulator